MLLLAYQPRAKSPSPMPVAAALDVLRRRILREPLGADGPLLESQALERLAEVVPPIARHAQSVATNNQEDSTPANLAPNVEPEPGSEETPREVDLSEQSGQREDHQIVRLPTEVPQVDETLPLESEWTAEGVESRAPKWLWENRVPLEGITVMSGEGALFAALALASALSRGGERPVEGGGLAEPTDVWVLHDEIEPELSLLPWVEAAGAGDLNFAQANGIEDTLDALETVRLHQQPGAVVLAPSLVTQVEDRNDAPEYFRELAIYAARYACAVIVVAPTGPPKALQARALMRLEVRHDQYMGERYVIGARPQIPAPVPMDMAFSLSWQEGVARLQWEPKGFWWAHW